MPAILSKRLAAFACFVMLLGAHPSASQADDGAKKTSDPKKTIRIATYNVSFYDKKAGQVAERLSDGRDAQAEKIARVIQTVRPDVLLLNEVDYDESGTVINTFADQFLPQPHGNQDALEYPFRYWAPSNTGVDSGLDLDNNGKKGQLADDWGFGNYEGQYAMAVLSRYPIDTQGLRSFQTFKWSDLPDALRPIDPKTGESYYSDQIWNSLRLSSKNHIDVPIRVDGHVIHLLASHPTPPVFDGKEDRNGCRNHDEIRFWSLYLSADLSANFQDDQGRRGGLPSDASFVIVGDLNSDPQQGDSRHEAIVSLIEHPRTIDPRPQRKQHPDRVDQPDEKEPTQTQTAKFGNGREYRIDYVLPSRTLKAIRSGVYWPTLNQSSSDLDKLAVEAIKATDHRLVWIEVELP